MSGWLGYESVYSLQARSFKHWCAIEAFMMAETVDQRAAIGGGDEWAVQARQQAAAMALSRHEIRSTLVTFASTDDREIVSIGHDSEGLVTSVVYHPATVFKYEPVWVPDTLKPLFLELVSILESSSLPFAHEDEMGGALSLGVPGLG